MVDDLRLPAGECRGQGDELEERGWTVPEFAEILARPVQVVSGILSGKKEITTETALAIRALADFADYHYG